MPVDPLAPIPRRLGRFEVIDRLAIGGMAEVFVCCERGLGGLERLAVVKRVLPNLAVHKTFVEMFLAEARYVARLNHPNVVQIIELSQDEQGAPFMAMEYVAGSSVRDLIIAAIDREKPTPLGAAVGIVVQACAGAHAAHELLDADGRALGLVHRDISPHNLMVTSDGHVKLLDFGIAKATQAVALEDFTATGALKGKIHYMSPEQCKQQALDRRSDVFALGIVLWEMIAQERLFKRGSDLESMQAIVTGDRKDLKSFRPDVPDALMGVIMKVLQPAKEDRYSTADEMRRALLDACARHNIACDVDTVAAFVRPLLGDAQSKRKTELLEQANERTATPQAKTPSVPLPKPLVTPESQTIVERPPPATVTKAKPSRRPSLTLLLVPLMFGATLAAALSITERFGPAQAKLSIGFPPTADEELMLADIEPMRAWMEKSLDRPVELSIAASYDDLQARILAGQLDIAALPPYLYVETKEKDARIEVVALKLVEGSSGNDSIMYVNEQSGVTQIADLKGKRFCFPDYKSTTGYLFPRLVLKKAGLDLGKDVITHLSGSHTQSLRDLVAGVCDGAATYSGGFLAADRAGVPVARVRQLAIIGRSPHDAMVLRATIPPEDRARITQAMLGFSPADGGKSGRVERISGFRTAKDADYDGVREAVTGAR